MAHSKEQQISESDHQQMQHIRELVFGQDAKYVKQTFKDNAREIVSDVFSESLKDRQQQDGTVGKELLPMIEKSVEQSIANNSDKFVGFLYPLVGSLVRKSVSAFITELLEKTNSLIENSLTFRGLKWRLKARQAGVTFSQYAASQTFAFRVEQVLLIHSETGLLLNSVSLGLKHEADADLVSSMLTAINDFVADSFATNADSNEQNLNVVTTDDFTLLLKKGPKACVVASVSGNMPQSVANQLQKTLEEIHRLYDQELNEFAGDSVPFESCQHQLKDCLMVELKVKQEAKKKPWIAWTILLFLVLGCSFLLVMRWQTHKLIEQIRLIDTAPGILLTAIETSGFKNIQLEVMRDPMAQSVQTWFEQHSIDQKHIILNERAYLSLDPPLIKSKVERVVERFSDVSLEWNNDKPIIIGRLTNLNKLLLREGLSKIAGLNFQYSWLDKVAIEELENKTASDPEIARAILDLNIAKIERISILFEPAQSELSELALEKIVDINQRLSKLIEVADQQMLSLGLIIMGSSDAVGTASFNKKLSQKRADNVKLKLQELGIATNRLNAIGLGVIDLKATSEGTRKVLFNVVYFERG